MATQFAERASGFGEFFTERGSQESETWGSNIPDYMPESVESDPVWIELADNGIGIRDAIRIALPELADSDDEELDDEISDIISEMSESEAEGFFDFVKKAASGVLKVAAPLAGVAGKVVGGAIGGPVGSMVGGMAGDLVGQGASALSRHLDRPSPRRRRRRGGGRRRQRGGGRRRSQGYGRSFRSGLGSMVQAAAPAIGQLAGQLRDPRAGAALGQAAGRQIANVAGSLSNIINSREMQQALGNVSAGLPAEITNMRGESVNAETLAMALSQTIIEAAEILESIETDDALYIESGELAEFVS